MAGSIKLDFVSQRNDRGVQKEYLSGLDNLDLVNNEISQEGQKLASHSSNAHNPTLIENHLPNTPISIEEYQSKQLSRTKKKLCGCYGGCFLFFALCWIVGSIWILVTSPLSNVGVTKSDDFDPKWSPDGDRIAFVSKRDGNADIYVMDSEGSNVSQLTEDPFALLSFMANSSRDLFPSWSPDGRKIVFSSERDDAMWSVTNFNTYVMDADGTNQVRLSDMGHQTWPAWSPDGLHIALVISRAGHINEEIYVMDADGSNLKRLTDNQKNDEHPSWSPDGKQIVFSTDRHGDWEIYVMDARDGSNQNRLTENSGNDLEPSWSPDGKYIVFTSDRNGEGDIYRMDADGSNVTLLTEDPANNSGPSWSPNGDKIVFCSDRDGDVEIYVMDADGSNVIQLTHN